MRRFLWFAKVKYVKSSSFSYSIKFAQSLFYRFNQNELVHNKLQIHYIESVETIGECNFRDCLNLESATVCSKETGLATFYNCINLTGVELSDNVEEITGYTFQRCKSLETIELGDSITHIHYRAFWECEKLKSIIIPQNVRYLGNFLLANCFSIEYVVSLIDKPVEVRYDG